MQLLLRQSIISFSSDALRSNTACRILDSDIGPLKFSFCYDPYPSVPINSPIYPFYIPILRDVNHFKALVPPHNYDLSAPQVSSTVESFLQDICD